MLFSHQGISMLEYQTFNFYVFPDDSAWQSNLIRYLRSRIVLQLAANISADPCCSLRIVCVLVWTKRQGNEDAPARANEL